MITFLDASGLFVRASLICVPVIMSCGVLIQV